MKWIFPKPCCSVGINDKPGLLALAMEKYVDANGKEDLRGWPFVVPGGRFNELYGNIQCW